jgi:CHAT domain-containing protein
MKSDFAQALRFLKKSVSIKRAVLGELHSDVAMGYGNIGEVYRKTGDQDQALHFYKKALAVHLASPGTYHYELAETYASIGEVYESRGDYDQALAFYQRAIGASVLEFSNRTPLDNPTLDNILFEQTLLASLAKKARALAKRFTKQSHPLRDLEAAVSTYQLASQLIDQMRYGYKAEGSKLFLEEQATAIYGQAIQTALRLQRATQADEHKHTAFLFAEKSKTGIMLEALSEAEAKQFAGIPDSLLEKERELRLDLAVYEKSLTEEQLKRPGADSAKIALWQDKMFGLQQAYDALLQRFEKDYPDYYNLKYQTKTTSVPEVQQQLLDDRTALVEYFTGKDSIFIFALTHDDFIVKTSAKDSLFALQIEQLRQGIIEQDFARYTQAAVRLYQILLAPVASMLDGKNLILVPDGALSAIPFEALLTHAVNPAGGLKDYPELPYLLEAHAISYAYSATLLEQEQRRRKRETKRDYLALAPVFPEGLPAGTRGAAFIKENFAEDSSQAAPATRLRSFLPATKTEVTGIFARFENSYGLFERWFGNKSRVYLEREAKEEKLKAADLSSYRFLHFATHGLVNEKNPKLSGLILTQEDTASNEDGILHLGEIYNLNLNAELVVLSACETGLGQIAQGEGIIGLTRGFLYAGASNVLVSLWQVSDMTTADLMVDFYDKLLAGMSKAEALAEAKRQMIRRDPGYAKPYYWAPFILVGR